MKILLIEDDQLMVKVYEQIFTLEHFEVSVAVNGMEGLAKIQGNKPDLILLDVMMPEMNGLEVLNQLKSHPDTVNIPVVMLTNVTGEKDAQAALNRGALKYIIKSEHDPKEIVDMVRSILSSTASH